jgi:hypothetical protein
MQTIKDFNMKKKRLIHFFVSLPEQKRRCDICRLCKTKIETKIETKQ